MRVLDLFSGIGGFSLGLERAGMRTVAFCEIDPYCRKVLRKHWPDTDIPIFDDVRSLTAALLRFRGVWGIDVICGGFPCQDISLAGKGAGIDGECSGLWSEYARIIGEVRPRYVIVENVAALLGRGLSRVLGDLAALGYDAEWHCIPASAVGAPHRRDRLWIVAYTDDRRELQSPRRVGKIGERISDSGQAVADGTQQHGNGVEQSGPRRWIKLTNSDWWSIEPDVGRVANGVSNRVDRLRALGNAVVPQITEIIGKAIMETRGA